MKNHLLKTTLLALAGTIAIASSSDLAQSSTTYAQGDFLLGFRATSGTGAGSNVLVDLGPGTSFLSSPTPTTFNLSNLFGSLNTTYGNGWTGRWDHLWGVSAADASSNSTVYVTVPTTPGSDATPWNGLGTSLQTGVRNKINSAGGLVPTSGYNFYITNTNPSGAGPAVIEGQGDTNSWGSFMPGGTTTNSGPSPGISWAQFNPTIEGTFANGTSGVSLDLIRLTNTTGSGNPGVDLGDFTITDNGIVTFTPDSFEAVPEPSTYAAAMLGAVAVLFAARRKRTGTAKA